MNRNNIWIHVGIAVVLVTMAAVLGQIGRWRAALKEPNTSSTKQFEAPKGPNRQTKNGQPEVLVRFKPGVSLDRIRSIASAHNDVVKDEIESVGGLSIIDDLDNADPQAVVDQYSAMT